MNIAIENRPRGFTADGSVSYILEWNGLKFAHSSDTFPNKWWIKYTKGVDISIHECFAAPQILLDKQKYRPDFALQLSAIKHTSPMQFGKVMAMTKPRLAVGYHFYNDHDTLPAQMADVRKLYDGPLAMATDYMVFNVTRDKIQDVNTLVDIRSVYQVTVVDRGPYESGVFQRLGTAGISLVFLASSRIQTSGLGHQFWRSRIGDIPDVDALTIVSSNQEVVTPYVEVVPSPTVILQLRVVGATVDGAVALIGIGFSYDRA